MTWVNVKGVITWKQVSSSPTEAHQTLWTTEEWLWLMRTASAQQQSSLQSQDLNKSIRVMEIDSSVVAPGACHWLSVPLSLLPKPGHPNMTHRRQNLQFSSTAVQK